MDEDEVRFPLSVLATPTNKMFTKVQLQQMKQKRQADYVRTIEKLRQKTQESMSKNNVTM